MVRLDYRGMGGTGVKGFFEHDDTTFINGDKYMRMKKMYYSLLMGHLHYVQVQLCHLTGGLLVVDIHSALCLSSTS